MPQTLRKWRQCDGYVQGQHHGVGSPRERYRRLYLGVQGGFFGQEDEETVVGDPSPTLAHVARSRLGLGRRPPTREAPHPGASWAIVGPAAAFSLRGAVVTQGELASRDLHEAGLVALGLHFPE